MKKLLGFLLSLVMLLSAVSVSTGETATEEKTGKISGTATGTAAGFGGEVSVTLTLEDGAITGAVLTGDNETEGIGRVVIAEYGQNFVEANGICDAYTGATFAGYTRGAVLEAALAALTQLGADPLDYLVELTEEAQEDLELTADVAVVGAGGAGLTAALTVSDAGGSVVVLESQAAPGGNSVKSTGGMNAAKTAYQDENAFAEEAGVEKTLKAAEAYADNGAVAELAAKVREQWEAWKADPKGYFDSTELFALDTILGGKGLNNPELVKTLVENSAAGIEWLRSKDVYLDHVSAFGGASVKRIHRPVNEEGKTVSVGAYTIPRLVKAAETRENIAVLTDTTVTEILTDEAGNVCGVKGVYKTGNQVTVRAKAVILATGGFGANMDMVTKYAPQLQGFMTTNSAGARGQGIDMAQKLGAATVDMEQIQIHPTVQADTAALITEGLRGDGAVLVNAEGKRFVDEVGTRDVVSAAEIAQTGSCSWLIVDQRMADASSVIQGYIDKGYTFSGNTWEELAEAIGVPAEALAETMKTWNGYAAEGKDPDFGRTSFALPLDTAPYYAIRVTAGIHHTMGGLRIDARTRVLREDGTAIPGLYAAGEVTGGVHGANRLGGNAVADFVVFGRIAGEEAAARALEDGISADGVDGAEK